MARSLQSPSPCSPTFTFSTQGSDISPFPLHYSSNPHTPSTNSLFITMVWNFNLSTKAGDADTLTSSLNSPSALSAASSSPSYLSDAYTAKSSCLPTEYSLASNAASESRSPLSYFSRSSQTILPETTPDPLQDSINTLPDATSMLTNPDGTWNHTALTAAGATLALGLVAAGTAYCWKNNQPQKRREIRRPTEKSLLDDDGTYCPEYKCM